MNLRDDNMSNCCCEITQEENDLRLFLIELYGNCCPVCRNTNVLNVTDWEFDIDFNTQKLVHVCDECGYIAKEKHTW